MISPKCANIWYKTDQFETENLKILLLLQQNGILEDLKQFYPWEHKEQRLHTYVHEHFTQKTK